MSKSSGAISNGGWCRRRSSAATHRWNAHERQREKTTFSWSALLLAKSQGQAAKVLLFTFLTWGWGRKGEGSSEVRASAGPPGTPLPGGRKSMWFLSYLWEGLSTASNTDIQWAAERRKKADSEDENAWTQLPPRSHLFIEPATVNMCANVSIRKPTHKRLDASARRHVPQQPVARCRYTNDWVREKVW